MLVVFFLRKNLISNEDEVAIEGENVELEEVKKEKEEIDAEEEKKEEFIEYQNQTYNYSISFSDKWNMNNDYSEKKLEDKKVNEKFDMEVGGQTFWSNYSDINRYNPSNRPKDFYLLALTIYKDRDRNIVVEKFAEKIGFEKELTEAVSFENGNMKGMEFVSPGAEKGKPRIAIIFQKENLFYVFNLAFADNKETVEKMEGIVKAFKIN